MLFCDISSLNLASQLLFQDLTVSFVKCGRLSTCNRNVYDSETNFWGRKMARKHFHFFLTVFGWDQLWHIIYFIWILLEFLVLNLGGDYFLRGLFFSSQSLGNYEKKNTIDYSSIYLNPYSLVDLVVGGRWGKKSAQLNDILTLLCACHSFLSLFLTSGDLSLILICLAAFKGKSPSSLLICEKQSSMNYHIS